MALQFIPRLGENLRSTTYVNALAPSLNWSRVWAGIAGHICHYDGFEGGGLQGPARK